MPEFFIELYTFEEEQSVRTEWIRNPETGQAIGKREITVMDMVPVGFCTQVMEFNDYREAISWCKEHTTPEHEYHLAAESPEELRGIDLTEYSE